MVEIEAGTGPCPSVYGNSAEVRGLKGGGDLEKCNQSAAEREILARVGQSIEYIEMAAGFGLEGFHFHGCH
jgi:hypothetical protein